jgi:glycosyltransferase involved in cell wall biosynthesis
MVIAFSFLSEVESDKNQNFILEIFNIISKSHPEHKFIFITNKPPEDLLNFPKNTESVVIDYEVKTALQRLYYLNIKLPKVLKKYKTDVLVSENFCSLISKVPQILISPDLSFIHQPLFVKKRDQLFYKKFTPKFLKKAIKIIAFSAFEKADIIKQFKIDAEKIQVIYPGIVENGEPINFEEKEIIKEKYAGGNEFFIYSGTISPHKNLVNLLKAFSAFKKRQRSKMQLIIAGKPGKKYEEFIESLRLYRFKDEVRLLENSVLSEELLKISSSAYAMVYPTVYENTAEVPLQAMKCEVPVITSGSGVMPELCGDAALFVDPENSKDIAEKMMLIFKDEKMRKELIEKGKVQAEKYNWEKSALAMWGLIEKHFPN